MSAPHATKDGGPLDNAPRSTRQLLDELDALMNQMLALPVVDDPATPEAPPSSPPIEQALAPTLTMIELPPEPTAPQTPIPIKKWSNGIPAEPAPAKDDFVYPALKRGKKSTDRDKHSQKTPLNPPRVRKPDDEKSLAATVMEFSITVPRPEPADVVEATPTLPSVDLPEVSASVLLPAEPAPRPSRPIPRSNASWAIKTATVWDRAFRRQTRRLGVLGWILRSIGGRFLLGLAGLSCWLIALYWLVKDWLQWTG